MTNLENRLGCLRVLAACVREAGKVEGRVRLQKTCYLLKRLGVPELSSVDYAYYHYGPYSAEIAEVLREGVQGGVCCESADTYDDEWQRYTYTPGRDAGPMAAQLPARTKEVIARAVPRCQGEHWRTLELAATIDFLAAEEKLETAVAEGRALELKPACRPYLGHAERLLADLGLLEAK